MATAREQERWDPVLTARPGIRIADAVRRARADGGYYTGWVGEVDLDLDLDLGLLRVAIHLSDEIRFVETRIAPEPMPKGGTRYKADCMACGDRTLRVFASEDRAHLVCTACAGARFASRSLSNERRLAWGGSKLLARAGAAHVLLTDADAALHVPLRVRARMERYVARFLRRHGERLARAGRVGGRAATTAGVARVGAGDLREVHLALRGLLDELIAREERTGRLDPAIGKVMLADARVLGLAGALRARTAPTYWRRQVERAARTVQPARPVRPRAPPSGPGSAGPAASAIAPWLPAEPHAAEVGLVEP